MSEQGTGRAILLEPLSNMQDSTSLAKHGNVVIMFAGYGHNSAPSIFKTDDFDTCVRKWLADNLYDPAVDAFVIAGRTTKVAIALAIICSEFPEDTVKIMIFDGTRGEYVERDLFS